LVCTLTHMRCLPADRYLTIFLTLTILTEILRLRLRMTMRAGRKERNAVCRLISDFYRLIPAPILRRLRRHPLPKEGGFSSSSCSTCETKASPVTPCFPLRESAAQAAKGCTGLQVEMIFSAALTAKRQPSRRPVFIADSLICFEYRDSSPAAQNDDEGGK
jgi:hypothetical protein